MDDPLSSLVDRARATITAVSRMSLDERLDRAREAARLLEAAGDRIVRTAVAEVGQPLRFARRELGSALQLMAALPDLAEALRPRDVPAVSGRTVLEWRPFGVVFGWHAANSPVWVPTLVTQSALVAGNAVLSRPSGRARDTTRLVLQALAGAWPEDSVVRVDEAAPEAQGLIVHPGVDLVVAHSSTATCKRHLALLGECYASGGLLRPYIPEASGNDALLVLPGADVPAAARAAATAAFANGGQLCMSAKRLITVRELAPAFIAALTSAVDELVVGDPADEATDVAALSSGTAHGRAMADLAEAQAAGGVVIIGGADDGGGLKPTVVQLPTDALHVGLWRDESFAPLRSLVVADDTEHAIALANDTAFGLGAAVFGGTREYVDRVRGSRVVVDTSPLYQDPHLVVGGVRESGLAGARPKLEQFAYARRVHYEAPGGS